MTTKFRIISFNAEGISVNKSELLANLEADILCLQETHKDLVPPRIPGMHLVIFHSSPVHGSAIFARDKSIILNSKDISDGGLEILQVDTEHINITTVYKPPPTNFTWPQTHQLGNKACLVIGDFNSHSTSWGYSHTNSDGEAVENWASTHDLTLLHDAKDKASFQSARWRRGYNPDLAFVSSRHYQNVEKLIGDPIPKSQHRPIIIDTKPVIRPRETKPKPRFNFRKANWESFESDLEVGVSNISPVPKHYNDFQSLVWEVSKKYIPRGCRKNYIAGLSEQSKEQYMEYTQAYNEDPFAESTLELGEELLASIGSERRERWHELITTINMTHNSKKAWATIDKLNSEKEPQPRLAAVTPNQVAHQLMLNGKPHNKERGYLKQMRQDMDRIMQDSDNNFRLFTLEDLNAAMKHLKSGRAAGLNGITTEIISHFGDETKAWLLLLFNSCATTYQIPKIWRRARVVALLKPGKDPSSPKSYRPISLLCILYKLYERMILARIQPTVEEQLSTDQAGFRPGRSCCSQILNLTQYIEDGFEKKQITGAVFVDLTAAYDTVNHRSLLLKVAQTIRNNSIVHIIESLLTNRRFFVEMDGRQSRWRIQNNGLPQGSVLAPTLFNIYTNDQPQYQNIRRYIYADDLCISTQSDSFTTIEERLSNALTTLSAYYKKWHLNANPSKTQVCAFHLNNRLANRKLKIKWGDNELENHPHPVYLGVTLDRTLSFKEHINKTKYKAATRNNLLSKLANTSWGTDPETLRQTALALCYSTAEYCAPVWTRSCHAHNVDPELNKSCRIITGTLKSTPLPSLYKVAGIPPPHIRRETLARTEKNKQINDSRHPLHNHQEVRKRLKSRKSFATVDGLEPTRAADHRLEKWRESDQWPPNEALPIPNEGLPSGTTLTRKDWVTLNRARVKVGKTGDNRHRWGFTTNPECPCGTTPQTMEHILRGCPLGPHCSDRDLREANDNALLWVRHWRDKI